MNLFSEVGFELSGKTEKYKTANIFLLAFGHNCCGFSTFKLDDTANLQSFLNSERTEENSRKEKCNKQNRGKQIVLRMLM